MQCAELSCRYKTQTFTRPGQCAEQFQELQICVSPQFRMIDSPNPTRGFIRQNQNVRFATAACHPKFQNVRFATAACTKMHETNAGRLWSPAACKNHRFTTVSDGRPARKGCSTVDGKICISPQFWTSDEHEVTRGLTWGAIWTRKMCPKSVWPNELENDGVYVKTGRGRENRRWT